MARIERRFTLYRDAHFHAAFPSLARLADGSVLCAFRRARDPRWLLGDGVRAHADASASHWEPRSHLATLALDAAGQPSGPLSVVPGDPEAAAQDASLLVTSRGAIVLASFGWYPLVSGSTMLALPAHAAPTLAGDEAAVLAHTVTYLAWGVYAQRSVDGGARWSEPAYVPAVPGAADLVPGKRACLGLGARGALVEREGEILLATYGARVAGGAPSSHLYASGDDGVSFAYRAPIAADARVSLLEPSLLAGGAGVVTAWMRTTGLDDRVATAESRDGGRTFAPFRARELRGHPTHALRLADGRVALTVGRRRAPFGVALRLVAGDLSDVDEAPDVIVADDAPSADCGYPWAVELEPGRVLVAWYAADASGVRGIEAATVAI